MLYSCLIIVLSFLITFSVGAVNLGHRAGADVYKNLPENSISILRRSLSGNIGERPLQFHSDFKYIEFDVQETRDGHLVVFHDRTIFRMLPFQGKNSRLYLSWRSTGEVLKSYDRLRIQDLTAKQLSQLKLKPTFIEGVPLLQDFLQEMADGGLIKPVAVEIKRLRSDRARRELLELVSEFRDEYMAFVDIVEVPGFDLLDQTGFIASQRKFAKAFKNRYYWCREMKRHGFNGVSQTGVHSNDLCLK